MNCVTSLYVCSEINLNIGKSSKNSKVQVKSMGIYKYLVECECWNDNKQNALHKSIERHVLIFAL